MILWLNTKMEDHYVIFVMTNFPIQDALNVEKESARDVESQSEMKTIHAG